MHGTHLVRGTEWRIQSHRHRGLVHARHELPRFPNDGREPRVRRSEQLRLQSILPIVVVVVVVFFAGLAVVGVAVFLGPPPGPVRAARIIRPLPRDARPQRGDEIIRAPFLGGRRLRRVVAARRRPRPRAEVGPPVAFLPPRPPPVALLLLPLLFFLGIRMTVRRLLARRRRAGPATASKE